MAPPLRVAAKSPPAVVAGLDLSITKALRPASSLADFCLATQARFTPLHALGVGGDVKMFSQTLDSLPDHIREWTAGLHLGVTRLARLDAPIVAAVHATAMGGAVGLLAGCDLVYCARSAQLGGAYTKIGYTCDMGATFTLASRMGLSRARRFLLLGEVLTAEQGERSGLVDYVVDDAELLQEAENAAIRLAHGPTRAYGELRRLMTSAMSQGFERQLEDEVQGLIRAASTEDAREGIMAFIERRVAKFRGR